MASTSYSNGQYVEISPDYTAPGQPQRWIIGTVTNVGKVIRFDGSQYVTVATRDGRWLNMKVDGGRLRVLQCPQCGCHMDTKMRKIGDA